jgi:hypothetical protein
MNSLLMLVLTVSTPGADPMPVIQSTPTMAPSYQSGDSSWFSRFRSRPSLLSRLRDRFGHSSGTESYPSGTMTSYPSTSGVPGTMTSGRIAPVPVSTPGASSTPSYGTSSGSAYTPGRPYSAGSVYSSGSMYNGASSPVSTTTPQRMPQ